MKKLYLVFLIAFAAFNTCKAQYVTIPDTNFVNWLDTSGFISCMNGNQLDTNCALVTSTTELTMTGVPIRNLSGIQYFKSLDSLDCANDSLYIIPALPASLTAFNCDDNHLDSLPTLPASLQFLECSSNKIAALPSLPSTLQFLDCGDNFLTSLPTLPSSLLILNCSENGLIHLPALPADLQTLDCVYDQLTSLTSLPAALNTLNCGSNQITVIPALPASLRNFSCGGNQLTTLPILPDSLQGLGCGFNPLHNLPAALPVNLSLLSCNSDSLTSLPILPPLMQSLECSNNMLTSLPFLPHNVWYLDCSYNQLTSLPNLPPSYFAYWQLYCSYNHLTSLPPLPPLMSTLICNNNPDLSCLPEIDIISSNLDFRNTAITCLPNYGTVGSSIPPFDSVPLCGILNSGGCGVYWDISGTAFYDANNDCILDDTDVGTPYAKMQFYNQGILQQQIYTGGLGDYSFRSPGYGTYVIRLDTTNLPFTMNCSFSDSLTVMLSAADSLSYQNNFALKCHTTGFDVGVLAIVNNNVIPRPATVVTVYTLAGDVSELYGAHCAAGISGQVQIIYTGQATYVGPAPGALTPTSVNGNVITWNIADFGAINFFTAFNLLYQISPTATAGTEVCFNVSVTPVTGDYNPTNNNGTFCFTIVDAIDPNEKEVFPHYVDSAGQWLTYTIRFQNTGTAPAVNVRITDTLDNNLDPSTFQLLTYSAKNVTQLFGNDVVFNFPGINLPDSATSASASCGYVQYKVKLKANLPLGTEINNTAYVYFDLNGAVVTNTTITVIGDSTADVRNLKPDVLVTLYPNPAHDYTIVSVSDNLIGSWLQLTDAVGRTILNQQITNAKYQLPTGVLSKGIYLVQVGEVVKKLVVE